MINQFPKAIMCKIVTFMPDPNSYQSLMLVNGMILIYVRTENNAE